MCVRYANSNFKIFYKWSGSELVAKSPTRLPLVKLLDYLSRPVRMMLARFNAVAYADCIFPYFSSRDLAVLPIHWVEAFASLDHVSWNLFVWKRRLCKSCSTSVSIASILKISLASCRAKIDSTGSSPIAIFCTSVIDSKLSLAKMSAVRFVIFT